MKNILVITVFMAIASTVIAQQPPMHERMHERLESQKVAFITEKVDLTPDEAKEFWPVYDEFQEKEQTIRKEMRPDKRVEEMTDQEAEELIMMHLKKEQQLADLRETYTKQFLEILPAKKVVRLQKAELEFKREMLKRIKERMHQHGNKDRRRN